MHEYLSLFFTFAKIGAVTFGGGLAMLPILERELAEKLRWTTHEDLLDYFAISQMTPGVIAVNVATFIGCKRKGISGACVATFGVIFPSIVVITFLAAFLSNFAEIEIVKKCFAGVNVAVAALLSKAFIRFFSSSIKNAVCALIFLAAAISVFAFDVPSIIVMVCAGAAGLFALKSGRRC